MSLRILVTGGAGYLGSILIPELLKAGHKVTVLDTFIFGQNSLADVCYLENFNVVRGDTRDEVLLKELTKDKDIVIPLAALVGAPLCNRDMIGTVTINRDAIKTLSEVLSPSQKILMPVTNSGYGIGQDGVYCTEETPLNPISTYGKTKVEAEEIILQRENSISFRLATVFGMSPRMRLDLLVNDFTYRAVNDGFIVIFEGHFKRNYVHIRDVARAFLHGIENFDKMKGEAYNVGLSDANLSKLELCAKIKEYVPNFTIMEAQIGKDPDQRNYIVSNEKIEATGFKPIYNLDAGIKELIKGYTIIKNSKFSNV
ncbi:NAD-dependent epimerase/dehydratase [Arcobacter nitrofigilis DSM 7299]|uniref:NAD-dependent epimerase/dehydratase n=1 Tax=Arcobacter nitrofigilis (strain ATCC 33309 / DSM 7299 / CCUG 15893 / LMG 7604 / NCTC 12251 / CI) TaxID=572480 RepID=D5V7F5_ARCNC|nr:NAD(P)-dependent oxidoreductase [Arcobacter nitrofigilis]ADG94575.1 NAD-dependent epimerase/dehydratase [Arcobacter nitrofigilis DSM 7299]